MATKVKKVSKLRVRRSGKKDGGNTVVATAAAAPSRSSARSNTTKASNTTTAHVASAAKASNTTKAHVASAATCDLIASPKSRGTGSASIAAAAKTTASIAAAAAAKTTASIAAAAAKTTSVAERGPFRRSGMAPNLQKKKRSKLRLLLRKPNGSGEPLQKSVTFNPGTKHDEEEEKSNRHVAAVGDEDCMVVDFNGCDGGANLSPTKEGQKGSAISRKRIKRTQPIVESIEKVEVKPVRNAKWSKTFGLNRQMKDDINFLLDGISPSCAMQTRLASLKKLCTNCEDEEYRRVFRLHVGVNDVLSRVEDATKKKNEALVLRITAFMFLLRGDTLGLDLTRNIMAFMLRVLQAPTAPSPLLQNGTAHLGDLYKSECQDIAKLLSHSVDTSIPYEFALLNTELKPQHLVVATICSLATQDPDSVLPELRLGGILEHVASEVNRIIKSDLHRNSPAASAWLRQCLYLIMSAVFRDKTNQSYLTSLRNCSLILSCSKLVNSSIAAFRSSSPDTFANNDELEETMLSMMTAMRCLLSLCNEHELACDRIATAGVIKTITRIALEDVTRTSVIPQAYQHDVLVLSLSLLINVVEHSVANREILANVFACEDGGVRNNAIARLVNLFRDRAMTETPDEDEETSNNVVAAYVTILLGCLVIENEDNGDTLCEEANANLIGEMSMHLREFLLYQRAAHVNDHVDLTNVHAIATVLDDCSHSHFPTEDNDNEIQAKDNRPGKVTV